MSEYDQLKVGTLFSHRGSTTCWIVVECSTYKRCLRLHSDGDINSWKYVTNSELQILTIADALLISNLKKLPEWVFQYFKQTPLEYETTSISLP